MFFIKRKKNDLYPGFNARLLATIIDITIIAIVTIPIVGLLSKIMYMGQEPNELMNEVVADISKNSYYRASEFFEDILLDPRVKEYFITNNNIYKLALEQIAQFLVMFGLLFYFWHKKQASPGKMMLSMKIVDSRDHSKPSKTQLVTRFTGYIISSLPLFLGFIWMAFDKKGQTWHDKLSNTVVIIDKKKEV